MAVLMPMTLPRSIDQRPAAIARVDRRIGLQEILMWIARHAGPMLRAQNARRNRSLQAKGAADGPDQRTGFDPFAVAKLAGT